MEILLGNIAKKIIDTLDKNKQCTELEQLQMYLGLQTLIYNLLVSTLILTLAYITGNFVESLLLFAIFGTLRIIAGGYHFDSIAKCTLTTTLIMVGGGKCVQIIHISLPLCTILCIFVNILFFSYMPKGTHKNPYTIKYSITQQKRLKLLSTTLSAIALLSNSILRTAIILSMLIVLFLLLPTWHHKFPTIE